MKKLKYVKLFEAFNFNVNELRSSETKPLYNLEEIKKSNEEFRNMEFEFNIAIDVEKPRVNADTFIEELLKGFKNMGRELHILGEEPEIIYDYTYVWFHTYTESQNFDFKGEEMEQEVESPVINIGMIRNLPGYGDKLDNFLSIYYSVEDEMWSLSNTGLTTYSVNDEDNSTKFGYWFEPDLIKMCLKKLV